MIRLLMLESDPQLVSAVARGLEASRIELVAERTVLAARRRAHAERFDAALLDCDLLDDDELSDFGRLPLILATARLEPAGDHRFFARGVLLGKPFTSAQLMAALHETCAPLRERRASVVEVLRRANSASESVTLRVDDALVVLEQGEVVHAERGAQRGAAALAHVLTLPQPAITRLPARAGLRTIDRPFQALMLELLQSIEEREEHGHE